MVTLWFTTFSITCRLCSTFDHVLSQPKEARTRLEMDKSLLYIALSSLSHYKRKHRSHMMLNFWKGSLVSVYCPQQSCDKQPKLRDCSDHIGVQKVQLSQKCQKCLEISPDVLTNTRQSTGQEHNE